MAHQIHCRIRSGKPIFRVWSTITDSYITEEMTEQEVTQFVLDDTIKTVTKQVNIETPHQIDRAKSTGTSSQIDNPHLINGPWKKELNPQSGT